METLLDIDRLVFEPPELGADLYLPGLPGADSRTGDRSPYGNVGVITGAVWKRLPGGLWYLQFDGLDDHVNCGKGKCFDLSGPVTVAAWINIAGSGYRTVIGDYDAAPSKAQFLVDVKNSNQLRFCSERSGSLEVVSNRVIPVGSWAHIAAARFSADGAIHLFINGVLDNTGTSEPAKIATFAEVGNTSVGRPGDYAGSYFNGGIALLRVYCRALSALEIQNSFNLERRLFGV